MRPKSRVVVSVVVVNWNRRELLRACLESLAAQRQVSFEVIVVDNGSHDGSVGMLQSEFAGREDFRLRIVTNDRNLGFCAANNQGIHLAGGDFVALLNNDAEAEPEWLLRLLEVFAGRPSLGMAASKILVYEDPRRIDKAGHLIYFDGQNRGRGSGQLDRGQFERVEEVLWPDGCAAMYRRSMLEEIGGFDEDLFAYGDDAELGLRARIAGWQCLYAPQAVVRHHRGSTLGLLSFRRLKLIERNRVLLAVKHFPLRLLAANLWFYALRLGAGFWAAARGRGEAGRFPGLRGKLLIAGALLAGDVAALLSLPGTLLKRWRLRTLRRLTSGQIRSMLSAGRISLRELSEQAI